MADLEPVEADSRFPSGNWLGFFLDQRVPGKHSMELLLTFRAGSITGEGRDRVGPFLVNGTYDLGSGACQFRKAYSKAHALQYAGYNEGKGIWGTWDLEGLKGGFHIWPEEMGDPTRQVLREEAPLEFEEPLERIDEPELVPIGGGTA